MAFRMGENGSAVLGAIVDVINQYGGRPIAIFDGVVNTGACVEEYTSIPDAMDQLEGSVAIVGVTGIPHDSLAWPPLNDYPNSTDGENRMITLTGQFQVGAVTSDNTIVIQGSNRFLSYVTSKVARKFPEVIDPLNIRRTAKKNAEDRDLIVGAIRQATYYYYDVTVTDLVAVFTDPEVSIMTKIVSAYYTYMAQSRAMISAICTVLPLSNTMARTIAGWGDDGPSEGDILAVGGIGLFTPAYSIKENMARQIEGRLKAVGAASGVTPPSANQVSDMFTAANMGPVDMPAVLVPILTYTICIDRLWRVNADVKTADLVPIDDLARLYHMDEWTKGLCVQMRLIFNGYQATSVRFALAVQVLIRKYFVAVGGQFTGELVALQAAEVILTDAHYTGIRSTIPEGLQVKTTARCCYVGLCYYRKCLTTEEERVNFSKYAVPAVRAHIQPLSDADVCDHIVSVLPEKNIVAAASLGSRLAFDEMELIIAKYTAAEQGIIYKLLISSAHPGAWAEAKKEVLENEEKARIMHAGLEKLTVLERETDDDFSRRARHAETREESDQIREEQREWRNRVDSIKKKIVDMDVLLPPASDPSFIHVRAAVLEILQQIYKAIRGEPEEPPAETGGATPTEGEGEPNAQP